MNPVNESTDPIYLRRKLTGITLKMRRSRIGGWNSRVPLSVADYEFLQGGKCYRRKKITLATSGCSVPTCTMCAIPNESYYGGTTKPDLDDLIHQFESSFQGESMDSYELVSVYNSGNWFVDNEVPPQVRRSIYRTIANSECMALMVESLPQFIDERVIAEAKEYLGKKQLIVAIGLQSADDFIRSVCINTVCTKPQFERASNLLWQEGYVPRAYLLLKPPFLTEREGLEDINASMKYLFDLGYREVSISPMRVTPYTIAYELTRLGMYQPPYLWTIVETIRRAKLERPSMGIWISYLDKSGRDADTIYPSNCQSCTPRLREALRRFNAEQELSAICAVHCLCEVDYQRRLDLGEYKSLPERILAFLSAYEGAAKGNDS